jgi:hypothetical protein
VALRDNVLRRDDGEEEADPGRTLDAESSRD